MSAVYILDSKGRILINFDYRGEVDMTIPDKFMAHIQSNDKILPNPVFRVDDWCFAYIERASMFFIAVTRTNSNVTLLLTFLSSLAKLFEDYLGPLSAEAIIDNFSLVYELLDEVMDYGYPQVLDSQALNEYIIKDKPKELNAQPKNVPVSATGVVTWRKENLEYAVNEVFVDVIEKVNMLVAKNGAVIHNEIVGEINLATYLSGMPELRIGLNDKILFDQNSNQGDHQTDVSRRVFELEDIKFHPCVRLSQFERDRSITFIPPDGEFNLMTYRLSAAIKPIIHIDSTIERYKRSRVEMLIRARAQYRPQSVAQNVQIRVPVPPDVDTPKAQCTAGRMRYSPNDNALVWTIKQFPGRKQFSLRAHFGLPSVESEEEESKRPIVVNFEIPFFTVSGLRVQYLKVFEKSGYQAVTWVRYLTTDGTYEFRT
jgi:AP-1 complex subunit mu